MCEHYRQNSTTRGSFDGCQRVVPIFVLSRVFRVSGLEITVERAKLLPITEARHPSGAAGYLYKHTGYYVPRYVRSGVWHNSHCQLLLLSFYYSRPRSQLLFSDTIYHINEEGAKEARTISPI